MDFLEIVVQTENSIDVVRWNGSSFSNYPGWPQSWGAGRWIGDSSPLVGDVTGDGLPDVVFTGQVAGSGTDGWVFAYRDAVSRYRASRNRWRWGPAGCRPSPTWIETGETRSR